MTPRQPLRRALGALFLSACIGAMTSAQAQSWPEQPVRVVVPWPAGGLVDVAARQLGQRLQRALGQPVVIENRLGAGGTLGADVAAKAPPNGYTLLFSSSGLTINQALKPNLPFDLLRDLQPIALVGHAPAVLVVSAESGVKSVKDLIALAKSQPGKLTYASAGVGSPAHLIGELFKTREQLSALHVPFTGAPAAINEQLAGRIDFQFANAGVALPQVRSGKLRALAVTGVTRFASLPDVPTMMEAGVRDFEADQWLGLLASSGTPRAVVERLEKEVARILADAEFRAALESAGITSAQPASAQSFGDSMRRDLAKWRAVITAQNIKPE